MLRYGDDAERPITPAGDRASFASADHVYVRIGRDTAKVCGRPRAVKIRVKGRSKLVGNGGGRKSTVADGLLTLEN